jgi:hypothetical protein
MINIDAPRDQISYESVFASDDRVQWAISGLYSEMTVNDNFASGWLSSVTVLTGLSSDEIRNYYDFYLDFLQFEDNILNPNNPYVLPLWTTAYKTIYQSNQIIDGLNASSKISAGVKKLALGEAYFIRAFAHFYLTNLFGDVPIVLTSDYRENSKVSRLSQGKVYEQIVTDLLTAKENLSEEYPSGERVRVNKSTARALLSRVYLYQENWSMAEQEATAIIEKDDMYNLTNLKAVFLKNSNEAIWQLMPTSPYYNTWEGSVFMLSFGPEYFVIREETVNAFEPADARAIEWMDSLDNGIELLYYPTKYKVKTGSPPYQEYSMVFRLAEQFLIRAEARAHQDKLSLAIQDIDVLRRRANIPEIAISNPSISEDALILLILHERRVELLTEWGHRWLDLKRTNLATQEIAPLKDQWTATAVQYPIPQQEINNNRSLGKQNDGY